MREFTGRSRVCAALAAIIFLTQLTAAVADSTPAVLRVGTSGDYAPFSIRDADGGFTGFDIVVARRLAADLGRPIEFTPFRWPDLVRQLEAGAFDMAMSGVTLRPDRAVQILYTRPYVVTGAVAVIRKHDRARFRSLADLDRSGVRIGVNAGGHLEQVARQRFSHARLLPVAENASLPGILQRGNIDVAISEALEARTWPAKRFVTIGPFTRDRKAYALAPGAGDLLRDVNEWLVAREADGWLDQQRRQWFGDRFALTPAQAGFEALAAAIDLRLQLMPLVVAVKQREHLPIEDPQQEARVLEHVRAAAATVRLNPDDVAELFRVQIEAAKAVERSTPAASVAADLSLTQLRTAVAAASDQIIAEASRCRPWLGPSPARDRLDATLRRGLTASGVPPSLQKGLLDATYRVCSNE
ncbi:MAG: transporter substrate-binding domain-containing protein [Candidatus Binatia bacterium]